MKGRNRRGDIPNRSDRMSAQILCSAVVVSILKKSNRDCGNESKQQECFPLKISSMLNVDGSCTVSVTVPYHSPQNRY